jgi:DNA-binding LacI/PurR family transcriptional regulator
MATIREVAQLAGVSPATVSRVMNGTAKVDEEKRKRVEDAIRETGFKPNKLARALFKNSSGLIGLIVPNIDNPFFNEIAKAIEEEAYNKGLHIVLCSSGNNTQKEADNIQMLEQMKADGIILITNGNHTGRMIEKCSLPVIVVDRHITDCGEIAHIEADHYQGGKLAAEFLVKCGCRSIVCLRGPQEFTSGRLRYQGYCDVCRENGIPERYVDTKYSFESGIKAAYEMLERFPETDGIVAANDMVAISSYKVLRSKGIRVPEDIQIVGFDDIRFSSLVSPAVTTIHQPITEMGKRAVEIIFRYAEGSEYSEKNVFDVYLVERETTMRE